MNSLLMYSGTPKFFRGFDSCIWNKSMYSPIYRLMKSNYKYTPMAQPQFILSYLLSESGIGQDKMQNEDARYEIRPLITSRNRLIHFILHFFLFFSMFFSSFFTANSLRQRLYIYMITFTTEYVKQSDNLKLKFPQYVKTSQRSLLMM